MNLDHLSTTQLSYLEGMVEKCAEYGVDPRLIIKMAQAVTNAPPAVTNAPPAAKPSHWQEFLDEPPRSAFWRAMWAPKKFWAGGYMNRDPETLKKELAPYEARRYAGGTEVAATVPEDIKSKGFYAPAEEAYPWRNLVHRYNVEQTGGKPIGSKLTSDESRWADFYQKMIQTPEYQETMKKDYGPKGWSGMMSDVGEWLKPRPAYPKERAAAEGIDAMLERDRAGEEFRKKWLANPDVIKPELKPVPGGVYQSTRGIAPDPQPKITYRPLAAGTETSTTQ